MAVKNKKSFATLIDLISNNGDDLQQFNTLLNESNSNIDDGQQNEEKEKASQLELLKQPSTKWSDNHTEFGEKQSETPAFAKSTLPSKSAGLEKLPDA